MQNLLKLEFRKLKKQLAFYICLGAALSMILITFFTFNSMYSPDNSMFTYTHIDAMVNTFTSSSFITMAAVFIALNVCEDYGQKTVKNFYAKGYTRTEVSTAKIITVYTATTIMFLILELVGFILGSALFEAGDVGNYKFLAVIGAQYVSAMAYVSFFLAVSLIIQKIGGAIAISIVATTAINGLLSLADLLLENEKVQLADYWLEGTANSLTSISVTQDRMVTCLITSLIYIPVFLFLGQRLSKNREV